MLEVIIILYILLDVKRYTSDHNSALLTRTAIQVFFLFYLGGAFLWYVLSGFPKDILYLRTHQFHALSGLIASSASGYLGYLVFKSFVKKRQSNGEN